MRRLFFSSDLGELSAELLNVNILNTSSGQILREATQMLAQLADTALLMAILVHVTKILSRLAGPISLIALARSRHDSTFSKSGIALWIDHDCLLLLIRVKNGTSATNRTQTKGFGVPCATTTPHSHGET